jgi:trimeric autotransporter adhesin
VASDSDEIIGSLGIEIVGDYSPLEQAISDATQAATAGAQQIGAAFQSDAVDQTTESIQNLAQAADGAQDQLSLFADAASEVSDATGTAGDAADSASDQLSLFGDSAGESSDSLSGLSDAASEASDAVSETSDAASEASDSLGAIDDAASSASDSIAEVDDSASEAQDSLGGLDDAAASAGDSLGEIDSSAGEASDSIDEAGQSAEEAEGGLAGMAEQLTLLGESLAITEGLSEFGQEALTAYGTVQTLTIGLTALTGSAQQADDVVEQVKDLAATEPFKFPEIAPTIQQMVAMGVSAEQVGGVMQAVGNAAAATGNQFSAVAQMFDRMTVSGTVMTRSLATLGISTTDLGAAMGVTSGQVTAAFKALDQEDRINALSTALGKFGGVAEAEAQGIAGQWQLFQNQFEEVMVAVGQDIAPVVGDILDFGKSVLSGLETAASAFSGFSEPVQDVIVVLGLAVAAVVPLTAALAALGLGVIGLQGIIPAVTGLMSAFGASSAEAATAETALAEASGTAATAIGAEGAAAATAATETEALGLAATETATAEGALGAAATEAAGEAGLGGMATAAIGLSGALGVVGATLAGFAIGDWLGGIKDASQQLQQMSGFAKSLGVNLDQTSASGDGLSNAIKKLDTIAQSYGMDLQQGNLSQQEFAQALLESIKAAQGTAEANGMLATSAGSADKQVDALSQKLAGLKGSLIEAQTTLQIVQAEQDGTAKSSQLLQAATEAVTKAQQALNSELGVKTPAAATSAKNSVTGFQEAIGGVPDLIDSINQAVQKQNDTFENSMIAWVALDNTAGASSAAIQLAAQKVQTAIQQMGGATLDQTKEAIQTAFEAMGIDADTMIQKYLSDVNQFGAASTQASQDAAILSGAFGGNMKQMVQAIQDFITNCTSGGGLYPVLQNGQTVWVQQGAAAQQTAAQVTAAGTAAQDAATDQSELISVMVGGNAVWVTAKGVTDEAAAAASNLGAQSEGTYTIIRSGAAPIQAQVGDLNNLAAAHENAAAAATKTGQATQATTTIIGQSNSALTEATSIVQALGGAAQQSGFDWTTWNKQINDMTAAFQSTGNPMFQQAINLLNQEAQAAESAAGQMNNLAGATTRVSAADKGLASQNNAGILSGTAAANGLQSIEQSNNSQFGFNFSLGQFGFTSIAGSGLAPQANSYAEPGTGMVNPASAAGIMSGQDTGQIAPNAGAGAQGTDDLTSGLDDLIASMAGTTQAVGEMDYALVGGSLKPALDDTTLSVKAMDAQTTTLSSTVTQMTNSLVAPTSAFASFGDPLTQAQLALLAAGGTLNSTLNLTGQTMAVVTGDVANYNANLAAYTASEQQYVNSINQLNTASAILANTAGVATTDLGTGTAAVSDLGNAIQSLANVQASTATSAADLQAEMTGLQTQLQGATSDGYQYATQLAATSDTSKEATANLASTNDAANALQAGMGELGDELSSVTQGGTAAQGAAEALATAFGDNTSGLNAAMNANALLTGNIAANVIPGFTASLNELNGVIVGVGGHVDDTTAALNSGTTAWQALDTAASNATTATTALASAVTTLGTAASSSTSDLASKSYASAISAGLSPAEAQQMANAQVAAQAGAAPATLGTVGGLTSAANPSITQPGYATLGTESTTIAPGIGAPGANGSFNTAGLNASQIAAISAAQLGLSPEEYQNLLNGQNTAGPSSFSFSQGAGSEGGSFFNASAIPQAVPSGSGGTGGGTMAPITINISGMTPGNAQYVQNQMVTMLRNSGMKIT